MCNVRSSTCILVLTELINRKVVSLPLPLVCIAVAVVARVGAVALNPTGTFLDARP